MKFAIFCDVPNQSHALFRELIPFISVRRNLAPRYGFEIGVPITLAFSQ